MRAVNLGAGKGARRSNKIVESNEPLVPVRAKGVKECWGVAGVDFRFVPTPTRAAEDESAACAGSNGFVGFVDRRGAVAS